MVHTAEQDKLLKYFYELPFIGMGITSPENKRWLRFNDQLCEILGYSREELEKKTWVETTHPEDLAKDIAEFERVIRGNPKVTRWISDTFARMAPLSWPTSMSNASARAMERLTTSRHDTEHYRAAAAKSEILAARRQLEATLDAIPDLLFELDLQGRCHDYHSARMNLPALPIGKLVGKTISDVFSPDSAEIITAALQEAHDKGFSSGKQIKLELSSGILWFELSVSRKHVDPGSEPRFIMLARDVTERTAAEQRIKSLAHYDVLTGLPNRTLLADRLKVAIKRATRKSTRLAVCSSISTVSSRSMTHLDMTSETSY